jgi:Icc-related predicted phosphoesterase
LIEKYNTVTVLYLAFRPRKTLNHCKEEDLEEQQDEIMAKVYEIHKS